MTAAAAAKKIMHALDAKQRGWCGVYAAALEPVRLATVVCALRHCEASWWRCCAARHTVTRMMWAFVVAVAMGLSCGDSMKDTI